MIWVYVAVGCVVWCIGAGVFYEEPGRGDPVLAVLTAAAWPLWLLPVVLFALGQEVRCLFDARRAGKPREF